MIILVIAIGIILIALNLKTIKKEKATDFSEVIKEKENTIDKRDIEIGKIRKNMGESLTDLQIEIDELRDEIAFLKFKVRELEDKDKKKLEENNRISYNKEENIYIEEEAGVINEINFSKDNIPAEMSNKEKIKNLIEKGKTDDEICELLKVGKGEVLLIRKLFK